MALACARHCADEDLLAVVDLAREGDRYGTVVALTYMPIPTWHPLRGSIAHDHTGNQVQVYRLSDLALLKTITLPTNDGPNEPRVLPDGRAVLVGTVAGRLYRVAGLEGAAPRLALVHREAQSGCAMPLVMGGWWIQSNAATHRVFALDVRDLANVRVVSSVAFDDRQRPYWLSADGSRIVVVNEPGPGTERRVGRRVTKPSSGASSAPTSSSDRCGSGDSPLGSTGRRSTCTCARSRTT